MSDLTWNHLLTLHWEHPGLLLLALAPLGLLWAGTRLPPALAHYVDPPLREHLVRREVLPQATRWRYGLLSLGWLGLVVAVASPWLPSASITQRAALSSQTRHGLHWHIVIQVPLAGASSTALQEVRHQVRDWLPQLHGESISLYGYGAAPTWLLPATTDLALVRAALDRLDSEHVAVGGNRPGAALALIRQQLPEKRSQQAAILLITGYPGNLFETADWRLMQRLRQALHQDRIPVFAALSDPQAKARFAALEVPSLMIDAARGGAYSSVGDQTAGQPATLSVHYRAGRLNVPLPAASLPPGSTRQPLHGGPLVVGSLLILFALTSWRSLPVLIAAGVLLGLFVFARPATAALATAVATVPPAERQAWQAQRAGQWLQAMQLYEQSGGYRGHFGAGYAALRADQPAEARRHFELSWLLATTPKARRSAVYNLGHALAGLGRWEAAAQAWEEVLRQHPGDSAAAHNLKIARHESQRLRNAQGTQDLYGRKGYLLEGNALAQAPEDLPEPESSRGLRLNNQAGSLTAAGSSPSTRPALPFALQETDYRAAPGKSEHLTPVPKELQQGLQSRQGRRLKELVWSPR